MKEEYSLKVSEKRIQRILKENEITTQGKKKYKATKDSKAPENPCANILNQNFKVEEKNKKWTTDITYIWTKEGWSYLCCILDLWNKKIIAYEYGMEMTTQLVKRALIKAYEREKPQKGLIIHSDQGSQFTSKEYVETIEKLNMVRSMSRRGNCYDNSPIESFHATIKKEMIYLEKTLSMEEMRVKIFDYIEGFYNRERRHSSLGNLSPSKFELSRKPKENCPHY